MSAVLITLRSNYHPYPHRHYYSDVRINTGALEASVFVAAVGEEEETQMRVMRRLPMPNSRYYHHPSDCYDHRRYCQIPSVLPRRIHLPEPLSRQVPQSFLNPTRCRSFSAGVDVDRDLDLERYRSPPSDGNVEEDLATKLSKIVTQLFSTSDRNMEAVLDQSVGGGELTADVVIEILNRFRHAHRPAYRFFRWAGNRPGFRHDCRTYNKILSVLGKTRQFETMVAVLQEMENRNNALDMESFKIAGTTFAAAREMKKAVGVFTMMEKCGFEVGTESLNTLLNALAKEKLGKEAQQLFDRMCDKLKPDLKTYTVLLSSWCNAKNLIEAGRVWNQMVDKGFEPDVITYNVMIHGLIKGQRRPEAVKLFELMKAKGPRPHVSTYNVMVEDLCKHGKMDDAMDCFEEMIEDGLAPDEVTYTSLITGFGRARRMEEVPGLVKEMHEMGCPPDGKTYNVLIKLMTNYGQLEDAGRMYRKMVKDGIQPTIHTYNTLMKSYFRRNDCDMGCSVWEEMQRLGVCPDDNSYSVMIGGLIRHGRPEEALKYMEEMMDKGMKAPHFDYGKFAADFARAGKPDVLYEIAEKMNFSGKLKIANKFMGLAELMDKGVVRKGFGM